MITKPAYRPDISGLRAIAVLAITIFHINPRILPGGFVGVDAFFVISGFLITGNVWRSLNAGTFSFSAFYAGRVTRLFPALAAAILFTGVLGLLFLLPGELVALAKSMAASALQFSNVYFFFTIDYFSTGEISPLLHTWSLTVEEQFYLIFPALMFIIWKYKPSKLLAYLAVAGLASLFLSEFWVRSGQTSAAFYLTPSRMWQFIAGSIAALAPALLLRKTIWETVALASAVGIGLSIALLSEQAPFPGLSAIPITAATAALLYVGRYQSTVVSSALSFAPLEYLGKISYSLYLFHWPIIVFYKLMISPELKALEQVGLLAASIFLGALSYQFIETPFRARKAGRPAWKYVSAGAVSSVIVAALASTAWVANGLPSRFSSEVIQIAGAQRFDNTEWRPNKCFMLLSSSDQAKLDENSCILGKSPGKASILLFGDSAAAQYYPALKAQLSGADISQITASSCRPIMNLVGPKKCTDFLHETFSKFIPAGRFDAILLSGRWRTADLDELRETVEYLAQYTPAVYVLGVTPTWPLPFPRMVVANELGANKHNIGGDLIAFQEAKITERVLASGLLPPARYVSVMDQFCNDTGCEALTASGVPFVFDISHFTLDGAALVVGRALQGTALSELLHSNDRTQLK